MKVKLKNIQAKRKTLYKLLDSFEDVKINVVLQFAEFINTNTGKKTLKDLLSNAPIDNKSLSEKTLRRIDESGDEIKNKKCKSLDEVMKNYGL